jgi:catalase
MPSPSKSAKVKELGEIMPATTTDLSRDVLQAFDNLNGSQPTYRPAHAKGILLAGHFTPCPAGAAITRAPHLHRPSTPVTVRFSDFAGVPAIPDNDPNASPRGIAVRFHLADHVHTDIIAHSVDGFPVRTAEEFLEFLRAIYASGPGAPKPAPIETFLGTHPAALAFVQTPKPLPASFVSESYFAVNAYRFLGDRGADRFGRYRIVPDGEGRYLDGQAAAAASPNFLFDEIQSRLAAGPVKLRILVQLAEPGDVVDDSTVHWPAGRTQVEFGILELASVIPDNQAMQQRIIFDPIARVDGIASSGDPLLEPRADVYLASGRRRRSQ